MYDKKGSITRTFFTPNKWKGINTPSKWKGYFSKTPILFKAPNILKKSKIDNYQLIDNLRNRGITLPKRVPSKVILGESIVF